MSAVKHRFKAFRPPASPRHCALVPFCPRHLPRYPACRNLDVLSHQALLAALEHWFAPYARGISRLAQLRNFPLAEALRSLLDYPAQRRLDQEAPERLEVPSGSRIRIDYGADVPVLAVKLQELFGWQESPRIAAGRVPLLLHLLSPAGRPVQVTRDLAGFWRTGYRDVRKELRGRYPKHPWPEDPCTARPTRHTRARQRG
ncbi:hypothetical protein F3N43_06005 [Alkalilimnicola sp. S0819]|nr:hypothetical protein F3N43_06005 [Alkalilimnicola sp. S0819]MPQ16185.1 hypothetical protein [Alkalilimnicola sp. S0819]